MKIVKKVSLFLTLLLGLSLLFGTTALAEELPFEEARELTVGGCWQ